MTASLLLQPSEDNKNKVLVADYRHKGHRLNLISNLVQYFATEQQSVTVDLPEECLDTEEWGLHSEAIINHSASIKNSLKLIPNDQEINTWLYAVLSQAKTGGFSTLIIPWADKIMQYVAEVIDETSKDLHVHLLIGRYAPGITQYNGYTDPFNTLKASKKACKLVEGTNVYISRLSAAFDPIALDESTYSKNVNIVNDPVDDPVLKSPRWCREELSLPKNVKLALIAGHLSNRKKILRILKDWPEIYNESDVKLVLAGELKPSNESYEEIKDIINVNKECIIPRLRVIPVEDFPRYINAADIVICTYESGTYMPSGLAGLAYVNKMPMIAIDDRYITNLVNSFNFGIGLKHYSSLEFKKAVSLMGNKEVTKDDYHIEPTFTHTFEQMFTDCINKRRRHEI